MASTLPISGGGASVLSNLQGLVQGSIKTQQGPGQTLRGWVGPAGPQGSGLARLFEEAV